MDTKENKGDSSVVEYSSCLSHVEDGDDFYRRSRSGSAVDCGDDEDNDHCDEEATGLVVVHRPQNHSFNHNSNDDDEDGSEPFVIEYPDHRQRRSSVFRKTLFSDRSLTFRGIVLIEHGFPIKLLKFTLYTYAGIWTMFYWVRWMQWEHDGSLRLEDVWRYEVNLIMTDIMFFFVIGRLFQRKGIDNLEWFCWSMAASFYSSYITNFRMFQHSFTLYEMHCRWPWQLWVFVLLVIPVVATVAILHFLEAWRQGIVVAKFLEMIFCLTFLLAPLITSSYFHLHHWFAGFLVGMHLNFDTWWSRAAMAWCWGCYMNGIAVYGRDPVLTCGYAYFMSVTQRCPFVECYLEAMERPDHMIHDNITVAPMKPPDWRNCSADAYHP